MSGNPQPLSLQFIFLAMACLSPFETARADDRFLEQLALRWAPIHYQDVDQTGADSLGGRSDYITAINFDGDWNTKTNWANATRHPLEAHCYYSIVATETHWYVVYAFFHPRDWSDSPIFSALDTHENDLEGLQAIVRRPTKVQQTRFGSLQGIVTVFHNDFFSYVSVGSPLGDGEETVDGKLMMQNYRNQNHPVTGQESKGHGLKAWPHVDIVGGDGIIYYPSLETAEEPKGPNDRDVNYRLIDIFAEDGLWSHRKDPKTFAHFGVFGGDDGQDNSAHAPWRWDDHDDGGDLLGGELALDPLKLASIYFSNLGAFSRTYSRHPYMNVPAKIPAATWLMLQPHEYRPPHTRGDQDFFGHGPQVKITVRIRLNPARTEIESRIEMVAQEWDNGGLRRDYTTAQGTSSWKTVYTVPAGKRIKQITSQTTGSWTYLDENHEQDQFLQPGKRLVQRFVSTGDTKGDESGTRTGVTIYFNPVAVTWE